MSALRDALMRGDIDVAVHSLKDLPTAARRHHAGRHAPSARTRATPSSPGRGPWVSCRSAAGRHRLAASRRHSCTHSAIGLGSRYSWQRRHQARQGSSSGEYDARRVARAGLAGSAGSTRRPVWLDPRQRSPPPDREHSRSRVPAEDTELVTELARPTTRTTRAAVDASARTRPRSRVAALLRSEPGRCGSRARTGRDLGQGVALSRRSLLGAVSDRATMTPSDVGPGWRTRARRRAGH